MKTGRARTSEAERRAPRLPAPSSEAALVERYAPDVLRWIRLRYWRIPGADWDDVEQEALIGLLLAIRGHRPEAGPLWPFVRLCVERRLATVVRLADGKKYLPLNESLRVIYDDEGEELDPGEYHADERADVLRLLEGRRELRAILETELSPLERRTVDGFLAGYSYAEIEGCCFSRKAKIIDNALQRARAKLRKAAA